MSRMNWKQACVASALVAGLTGCENLPGDARSQGGVIGGVSGAAAGAAIGGEENRALGAILGGALGAAGGYVIGANVERRQGDRDAAVAAGEQAAQSPATAAAARNAATADINNDGFVTLDEVVALQNAGFTDQQVLARLRATGQVFDLTAEQQQYLRERGVSALVVNELNEINRATRDQFMNNQTGVISSDPAFR